MAQNDDSKQEWIEIIPCLHGKLTIDEKVSEPDINWILERWFERHPEFKSRRREVRVSRSMTTTQQGIRTEIVRATILAADDFHGYDASQDKDLYEYFLAEE